MNYLTMINSGNNTNVNTNEVLRPGTVRQDTNIYSVPLFYNDFYENANITSGTRDEQSTASDHMCNKPRKTTLPEPCTSSRYTPGTLRRCLTRDPMSRDSGTGSIERDSDVNNVMQVTDAENHPTYVNELPRLKQHKTHKCNRVLAAMFVGIVIGVAICSVVWLTIDKFRKEDFKCVLHSSFTVNKEDKLNTTETSISGETPHNNSQTAFATENESSTEVIAYVTSSHRNSSDNLSSITGNQTTTKTAGTSDTVTPPNPVTTTMHDISRTSLQSTSTNSTVTSLPTVLSTTDGTKTTSTGTSPNSNTDGLTESLLSTVTKQSTSTSVSIPTEETTSMVGSSSHSSNVNLTPETTYVTSPRANSLDMNSGTNEPIAAGLSLTTRDPEPAPVGPVYTRWGRQDCPDNTNMLYTGFVGGGHYVHSGGAASNLCLPSSPTWGNYNDALEADRNLIHITEYQSSDTSFHTIMGKSLHNQNVPCSVCQATGRSSHIMIPGRVQCLYGWHQEYTGYLMGGSFEHPHGKSLICIDKDSQPMPGGSGNEDGNLLYFVEFRGTTTANYVNGRELTCVVCTR